MSCARESVNAVTNTKVQPNAGNRQWRSPWTASTGSCHRFGPTNAGAAREAVVRLWTGDNGIRGENDVTRRRVFDPGTVPTAFWRRAEVCGALTRRDVAELFRLFLAGFPDCTQTRLALLTGHDRSDISNWVRGIRQSRVSDIEVLTRIADGLQLPDEARLLLGLASAGPVPTPRRERRPEARTEARALRWRYAGAGRPTPTPQPSIRQCNEKRPGTWCPGPLSRSGRGGQSVWAPALI